MPLPVLSRLGGARAYVPRKVRAKAASRDLEHRYRKLVAREARGALSDVGAAPGVAHATAPFCEEDEEESREDGAQASAVVSRKRARLEGPAPTRFKGAEAVARARADAHTVARAEAVALSAARARAATARKKSSRVVRRKTHKGQTLLSGRMGGLLAKIEREIGRR